MVKDPVRRASYALAAYRDAVGADGPDEEMISDLLADLMHLAGELYADECITASFYEMLSTATMNYEAEKEESE